MVVPVPEVLTKDQIHIAKQKDIDHLDAYTAPRLVEYFDKNPCAPQSMYESAPRASRMMKSTGSAPPMPQSGGGVTVEASYTVGEYDILILSAKDSGGLVSWLETNNYKIPENAGDVLASYIKQDTKFFCGQSESRRASENRFHQIAPAFHGF